jgi:hypothetical protein
MTREEILGEYARLQTVKRDAEKKIKELVPAILDHMAEASAIKLDTTVGVFQTEMRKSWTFSPKVAELEAAVEEQIKTEKADGTATFAEVKCLKFYSPKDESDE